jgi:hypothetical protein
MVEQIEVKQIRARHRLDEVRQMYLGLRDKLTAEEKAEWDRKLRELENTLDAMGANCV